jgi:hypothetical protein
MTGTSRTAVVRVRVTDAEKRWLEREAEALGLSLADYLRRNMLEPVADAQRELMRVTARMARMEAEFAARVEALELSLQYLSKQLPAPPDAPT